MLFFQHLLRALRFSFVFFFSLLITSSFTFAETKVSVDLNLKFYHKAQFAGIYMAKEKGYFDEAGLDVNIIEYIPERASIFLMQNGNFQYLISEPFEFLKAKKHYSIGIISQKSLMQGVLAIGVNSVNDLKGKNIVTSAGTSPVLKAWLLNNDIDANITIANTRANQTALTRQENFGMLVGYSTNEVYFYLKEHPQAKVVEITHFSGKETLVEYNNFSYGDLLVGNESEVANNPERALKLKKAIEKGWLYASNNQEETIDFIWNNYPIEQNGFTLDQTKHELATISSLLFDGTVDIGYQSFSKWIQMASHYGIDISDAALNELSTRIIKEEELVELQSLKASAELKQNMAIFVGLTFIVILAIYLLNKLRPILKAEHLSKAIKHGEFELYLQPLVKYNKANKFEALIRWNHPEKGLIPPYRFIHYIESNPKLSLQLDLFVVEQAFILLAKMANDTTSISINVTKQFWIYKHRCAVLRKLSEQYNVELSRLCIEITERFTENLRKENQNAISAVTKLGCLVAIDDFGVGYHNLSVLSEISVDIIKIDMSLVFNIEHCDKSRSLLKNIFAFIHSANHDIVCEGVENQQQLDIIHKLAANFSTPYIQGYFFDKPMPAKEAIAKWCE